MSGAINRSGRKKGAPKTGGRKAGTPNKATADIQQIARQYTTQAVQELARLATKAESEAARVSAIKELLDRGYGKSSQPVTADVNGSLVIELVQYASSHPK